MAILKGFPDKLWASDDFPPARTICSRVRINPKTDFSQPSEPCPKILDHLHKQNERVRAALVVYCLSFMEDNNIEPTPFNMMECLDVGMKFYNIYNFEKHGPYGDYITGHLKNYLTDNQYRTDVNSQVLFG